MPPDDVLRRHGERQAETEGVHLRQTQDFLQPATGPSQNLYAVENPSADDHKRKQAGRQLADAGRPPDERRKPGFQPITHRRHGARLESQLLIGSFQPLPAPGDLALSRVLKAPHVISSGKRRNSHKGIRDHVRHAGQEDERLGQHHGDFIENGRRGGAEGVDGSDMPPLAHVPVKTPRVEKTVSLVDFGADAQLAVFIDLKPIPLPRRAFPFEPACDGQKDGR